MVGFRSLAFLRPTLVSLLASAYLPFLIAAWKGVPALGSLVQRENANAPRVTLLYTLLTVPLSVALGLLAELGVEGTSRLRLLVRTLVFHPLILPAVAFAANFLYLLNPLDPLQGFLRWLGLQNPLGNPLGAFLAVVLVGVLKDAGLYMLYYLAGLQALPKEVLEAARVDGATTKDILYRIPIPANPTTLAAPSISPS